MTPLLYIELCDLYSLHDKVDLLNVIRSAKYEGGSDDVVSVSYYYQLCCYGRHRAVIVCIRRQVGSIIQMGASNSLKSAQANNRAFMPLGLMNCFQHRSTRG